jgi:hypothetical protein
VNNGAVTRRLSIATTFLLLVLVTACGGGSTPEPAATATLTPTAVTAPATSTPVPPTPTPTLAPGEVLVALGDGAVGRYLVQEQLARRNLPNDATGETSGVTGASYSAQTALYSWSAPASRATCRRW